MHPGQLLVSEQTVRSLVAEQFPQWAHLDVQKVSGSGTVNAVFRIGEDLAARFALQVSDDVLEQLDREGRAMTEFAGLCPFPAPVPVAFGRPGPGFALPWSVQSWVPGTTATDADPAASMEFADDLASLIGHLRAADTRGRHFTGTNRGGDIASHDAWMQTCFEHSAGLLDVSTLRSRWERLRGLPRRSPDRMCHGDLIPGNLLVAEGRLAGVIDTGGYGAADPALDLVVAWNLFEDGPRERLRGLLDVDDLEWARGMAWAFEQAMGLVWYYRRSNPVMSELGRRTLERIVSSGEASALVRGDGPAGE